MAYHVCGYFDFWNSYVLYFYSYYCVAFLLLLLVELFDNLNRLEEPLDEFEGVPVSLFLEEWKFQLINQQQIITKQ